MKNMIHLCSQNAVKIENKQSCPSLLREPPSWNVVLRKNELNVFSVLDFDWPNVMCITRALQGTL